MKGKWRGEVSTISQRTIREGEMGENGTEEGEGRVRAIPCFDLEKQIDYELRRSPRPQSRHPPFGWG